MISISRPGSSCARIISWREMYSFKYFTPPNSLRVPKHKPGFLLKKFSLSPFFHPFRSSLSHSFSSSSFFFPFPPLPPLINSQNYADVRAVKLSRDSIYISLVYRILISGSFRRGNLGELLIYAWLFPRCQLQLFRLIIGTEFRSPEI